jgi:hypothetical protein
MIKDSHIRLAVQRFLWQSLPHSQTSMGVGIGLKQPELYFFCTD